jgi:hypothetical protein
MLKWGLVTLGIGLALLLLFAVLNGAGVIYFGSCGPSPGALPLLLAYVVALPLGGLLTLIGLVQLAIDRFRHRKENEAVPRITPS